MSPGGRKPAPPAARRWAGTGRRGRRGAGGGRDTALTIGAGLTALGMGMLVPVLPGYARSLGASAFQIGLLLASFGLARLLVSLPATWLAARLGERWLLVGSPALIAPAAVLCALAGGFWPLALFCVVEGAAAAAYSTVGTAALVARPTRRGRALGAYQGAGLFGGAVGPALGGLVAQQFGVRSTFLLYAALAALAALLIARRYGRSGPSPQANQAPDAADLRPPAWRRLGARALLPLWLLAFALVFARVGTQLTIAPLLGTGALALGARQIGLALSLGGVAALALFSPAGWLADRHSGKAVVIGGGLVMAGALALFALGGGYGTFAVAAGLLGAGSGLVGPAALAYLGGVVPEAERGLGVGLYRTLGDAGAALAPPLLGWSADRGGFPAAFVVTLALQLVALGTFGRFAPAGRAGTAPGGG